MLSPVKLAAVLAVSATCSMAQVYTTCGASGTTSAAPASTVGTGGTPRQSFTGDGINKRPFTGGDRVHDGDEAVSAAGIVSLKIVKASGQTSSCTGSLIADDWVLTAAHCVIDSASNRPARRVTVYIGSLKRWRGASATGTPYCHAGYAGAAKGYANDLAMIKLNTAFPDARKMPLVSSNDRRMTALPSKRRVRINGYGRYQEGQLSQVLLTGIVRTAEGTPCRTKHHDRKSIFCSRTNGDTGFPSSLCPGDSGGPATYAHGGAPVQVGINSYINNDVTGSETYCGQPGNFAAFVEVRHYVGWIDAVMRGVQ